MGILNWLFGDKSANMTPKIRIDEVTNEVLNFYLKEGKKLKVTIWESDIDEGLNLNKTNSDIESFIERICIVMSWSSINKKISIGSLCDSRLLDIFMEWHDFTVSESPKKLEEVFPCLAGTEYALKSCYVVVYGEAAIKEIKSYDY